MRNVFFLLLGMKNFLLIGFILLLSNLSFGQNIDFTISGIRSKNGTIRLAFYTSAKNFEDEKPFMVKTVQKTNLKNGTLTVSYSGITPGLYGVALLDDENSNREMDYGLVLPKEGFGFSDYYHSGMSRPTFDQFDFHLKNETKNIKIKIRYM